MSDDQRIERIAQVYHEMASDGVDWAEAGTRYRTQTRKKVKLVLAALAYVDGSKRDE